MRVKDASVGCDILQIKTTASAMSWIASTPVSVAMTAPCELEINGLSMAATATDSDQRRRSPARAKLWRSNVQLKFVAGIPANGLIEVSVSRS